MHCFHVKIKLKMMTKHIKIQNLQKTNKKPKYFIIKKAANYSTK